MVDQMQYNLESAEYLGKSYYIMITKKQTYILVYIYIYMYISGRIYI